ncbi:MAG: hypothetical protein IJW04_01125 [Ruminococcus sp.]|nr:hypothetical protein [Ruminococcus sp.]
MDKKKLLTIYDKLFQNKVNKYWKLHKKAINSHGIRNILYSYRAKNIQNKYNSSFPIKKSINYFNTPHGFSGIFISTDSQIGTDCTIYQHVVIGSNRVKGSKGYGAPIIGHNVMIGAGAKIIGNVKIGNNVRIGANCCVATDIPNNATVVMEKPRIIIRTE